MQIVAFAGLARAGKTTAAETLAAWAFEAGYNVHIEQFAGPLKKASDILGWKKNSEHDCMYRKFCQWVGATARAYRFNWWVDLMHGKIVDRAADEALALSATNDKFHERLVIIDDVRYPNEVEMLRKNGAVLIFVCAAQRLTDLDAEWRQHESEQMASDYTAGKLPDDLFDYSLSSNCDLEAFKRVVVSMGPHWTKQIADENIRE